MVKSLTAFLLLLLTLSLLLSACSRNPDDEVGDLPGDELYGIYLLTVPDEKKLFFLELFTDHTFFYVETDHSNTHVGKGNFTTEGSTVTLVDESLEKSESRTITLRFRYRKGQLDFLQSKSDGTVCEALKKDSILQFVYAIQYTGDVLYVAEFPQFAKPGDRVEIRTQILPTADLEIRFNDGTPVEKTGQEDDLWVYSFTMPDHNVLLSIKAVQQ